MGIISTLAKAALITSAAAQVVSHTVGDYAISVNVPSDTASSKSGPIYFQITAPKGAQWAAFAQGSKMDGANMFVIYASGSNVILSPRTGSGHSTPQYDADIQASLIDGSGVVNGAMTANVRCDNCLKWSGGSMDPTSTSSNWIMAYKQGSSLNTDDKSANIARHDSHSSFTLDLTTGTGNNNPFVAASDSSSSSSESATATATSASGSASGTAAATTATGTSTRSQSTASSTGSSRTSSVSQPVASSNPNSSTSGSSSSSDSGSVSRTPTNSPFTHGLLMSILFVGFFPLFALTLYLPTTKKVRFVHAPLQMISVILLIAGLALGIVYGQTINELGGYHQVIGYIVVAIMVLAQPAMGIYQHLHYHKTGARSTIGVAHQWVGRGAIALGIVNGGIGWSLTDSTMAYVPYAIIAALMFLVYVGVVVWGMMKQRKNQGYPNDKEVSERRGYEMQNSKEARGVVTQI